MENENQNLKTEEMEAGFYSKKFKRLALEQLNGRWTVPVLVSLILFVFEILLLGIMMPWSTYATLLTDPTALETGLLNPADVLGAGYFIGLIASCILTPVIVMAQLYIFALLFKSKEQLKFSDFVSGFSYWTKALGNYFWKFLWLFLWGLAFGLIGAIVGLLFFFAIYSAAGADSVLAASMIPLFIYIFMLPAMIVKAYQYSLSDYIIVDNDEIGVIQALNISKKITSGYKWKLFCLDFSFIGWELLCCLFPIGTLWLEPYSYAAKTNAFHYILDEFNKRADSDKKALEAQQPKAIEDEPVSAEADTTDSNEV